MTVGTNYHPIAHSLFNQVSLDNGTLFSCGADGSMKMRKLPERDVVVNVRDF